MAVLTFPGADAVLAAQAAMLPQPDQMCGPFAAHAALHGVLDPAEVPTMVEIAGASGTRIWPHDVAAWRPVGVAGDRTGWEQLPSAADAGAAGTNAAGLARGIVGASSGAVAVVPVAGAGADAHSLLGLLRGLAESDTPIGVVANVWTGAFDFELRWDVGHFVVVWAVDIDGRARGRVAIADTYRELGDKGQPPGCRWVGTDRLAAAVGAPPGRGLLLLTTPDASPGLTATVSDAGLNCSIWST